MWSAEHIPFHIGNRLCGRQERREDQHTTRQKPEHSFLHRLLPSVTLRDRGLRADTGTLQYGGVAGTGQLAHHDDRNGDRALARQLVGRVLVVGLVVEVA
jgi:hypothetical protein